MLGVLGITSAGLMSLYSINIQAETRLKLQEEYNASYEIDMNQNSNANSNEANESQNEVDRNSISQRPAARIHINNYSDLGRAVYGQKGFVFVSFCLFMQQMCCVTAYFSFMSNYIPIAVALCVIIPFCLFLNIKKISYLSLFSLTAIISTLALVLYHSVEHMTVVPKTDLKYFDIVNFPYFFGVSIFIFEGN